MCVEKQFFCAWSSSQPHVVHKTLYAQKCTQRRIHCVIKCFSLKRKRIPLGVKVDKMLDLKSISRSFNLSLEPTVFKKFCSWVPPLLLHTFSCYETSTTPFPSTLHLNSTQPQLFKCSFFIFFPLKYIFLW